MAKPDKNKPLFNRKGDKNPTVENQEPAKPIQETKPEEEKEIKSSFKSDGKSDAIIQNINFGKILTDLLDNEDLTDITIRHGDEVWISGLHISQGHAKYVLNDHYTKDEINEFKDIVEKLPQQLAIKMNVMYNESQPSLDAEFMYKGIAQLRFNAIHSSLTDDGKQAIAIRMNTYKMRMDKQIILDTNYATQDVLNLMKCLVESGCNVIFMGITGSGKTEALKYFAKHIRNNESIITIEDTLEAYLKRHYPNKDVLALKSREEYDYSYLLRDCLRQNPDWIIVSEARGEEVKGLLEAVGTGHTLMTTIHGDNPANLPNRIIDMAKCDGQEAQSIFRQVHNKLDVCVYIRYVNDKDGAHRQITEMTEFYIDEQGKNRNHTFYRKDYSKNEFVKEKLLSPRILRKMEQSRTDTSKIKEIFI